MFSKNLGNEIEKITHFYMRHHYMPSTSSGYIHTRNTCNIIIISALLRKMKHTGIRRAFTKYVDKILPIIDHLPTHCWHLWKNLFSEIRENLHIIDISSTTYLSTRCIMTMIAESYPSNVIFRKSWSFSEYLSFVFFPAIISCVQFEIMMTF